MLVSVAAETRPGERRVALTPEAVSLLVGQGHDVRVESGAGLAALAADEDYGAAGADVRSGDVLEGADLVAHVRPLLPAQVARLRPGAVTVGFVTGPGGCTGARSDHPFGNAPEEHMRSRPDCESPSRSCSEPLLRRRRLLYDGTSGTTQIITSAVASSPAASASCDRLRQVVPPSPSSTSNVLQAGMIPSKASSSRERSPPDSVRTSLKASSPRNRNLAR